MIDPTTVILLASPIAAYLAYRESHRHDRTLANIAKLEHDLGFVDDDTDETPNVPSRGKFAAWFQIVLAPLDWIAAREARRLAALNAERDVWRDMARGSLRQSFDQAIQADQQFVRRFEKSNTIYKSTGPRVNPRLIDREGYL